MDRSSRSLLRRIALGLPLAAAPFGGLLISGFTLCGPCGAPAPIESMHVIALAQHDTLITPSGTIDPNACSTICTELRRGDAGLAADGALADGGVIVVNDGSWRCTLDRVEPDEVLTCISQEPAFGCGSGRRPQALVPSRRAGADVGAWLAEVAHLEAASVPAFDELAAELALHGAPSMLMRIARESADDERAHARMVASLAERLGARPAPVQRGEIAPRSLVALAEDNAAEGCVREAFGALAAAHQAAASNDARVRAVFTCIVRDEARYALFSFALHDWASERLGARSAARLEEGRREELARIASEIAEPGVERAAVLGLPDATRAAEMVALLAS